MARARMLSRSLTTSRKFAKLQTTAAELSEFCQLLFPLLVTYSDDHGRMPGDAFTVKYSVFPVSPRSEAEFDLALDHLHQVGLLERYTVEDEQYLQILKFEVHQTGLHKRIASKYPSPPGGSGKFREVPGNSASCARAEEKQKQKRNRRELHTRRDTPVDPVATAEPRSPTDPATAGAEIQQFLKYFCETYTTAREGAHYLVRAKVDVPQVKRLLAVYGRERLQKLAYILLTTDDDWVSDTDRGIGILSIKAPWLDDRLAQHEARRRA
jgi:hypothetical protein